jgi:hypothetical protein
MKKLKLQKEFVNESVELVHVYNKDGKVQGTGTVKKTKGKKSLVSFDAEKEEWFDTKDVKLLESEVNEATEVTQDMWDNDWKLKKVYGKEYDANFQKRLDAAISKAKNDDMAETWAFKNFKQLPSKAEGMTIDESVIAIVNEAKFNFSEDEVKNAAEQLAKAMSNTDKVKVEVHDFEYDKGKGAGFELSWDGDKSDGGSYYIKANGDVINAAIAGGTKYGTITSSARDFEKGIRATSKTRNESVTEGMSKGAIKKSIKIIDKQIDSETGGDGEPLDNETLQALERERERLESMLEGKLTEVKVDTGENKPWTLYVDGKKIKTFKTKRPCVIAYNKLVNGDTDFESIKMTTESNESKVNEAVLDFDTNYDQYHEAMGNMYKILSKQDKKLAREFTKAWQSVDDVLEEFHYTSESELTEKRNIQTKRKYTENHPAKSVGKTAKIRNKILEAIKDGRMTQSEFDKIVKETSSDHKRWMKRNSNLFNVSEDGISLSRFGHKILKGITINEIVVNESFKSFIDSLNA